MVIENAYIKDASGRTLMLRGCNLGGSSKTPCIPAGASWRKDSLENPKTVSFVGRPFPLEEADEHFRRLSRWGFTFIRFIITWEALEHAGPGLYDEEYLAYLRKILKKAEEYGISVFMDPHQDVWSRWTGGDGGPAWTLEKLGMDISRLDAAGAAVTQQRCRGKYPAMIWPVNYSRYAAATMFTLFFAGNTYAPETSIDGMGAQDWLQEQYLAAMRHCYRRLKNCGAIAGWGTMNEPHPGFIGCRDLERLENNLISLGAMPNPFQAMAAASGYPVTVPVYSTGIAGWRVRGSETINPEGLSLFNEGYECPWKKAGVGSDEGGTPRLLKKDHFSQLGGKPVRFADDFLKPFMIRFIERMRECNEKALFFIEGIPLGEQPRWTEKDGSSVVNAFHWYDGLTLFSKSFRPWLSVHINSRKLIFGKKAVQRSFSAQLGGAVRWAKTQMNGMPCLLGEFGLPFDMNRKKAFRTGDYSLHEEALSMYYNAADDNLLHSTIWNYTADNTNEHGDGWNDEDLSIYSGGKGRAAGGWLRPYPMATAGTPLKLKWDRKSGVFFYHFSAKADICEPTEIFAPGECFGENPRIRLSSSNGILPESVSFEHDRGRNRVFIFSKGWQGELILRIARS